jgi:hypothetical protein
MQRDRADEPGGKQSALTRLGHAHLPSLRDRLYRRISAGYAASADRQRPTERRFEFARCNQAAARRASMPRCGS